MQRHAVFLVRQLQEINFAIGQLEKLSQQGLKRKISRLVFKLFLGKGFTLSKYSPVTLHYSPATAILNKSHDTYQLSPVPCALTHVDGILRKSYKIILLTVLEDSVQVLPRLPGDNDDPLRANITDGMAAVQMIKTASVQAQASHFFEKFWSNFPVMLAVQVVKCPTNEHFKLPHPPATSQKFSHGSSHLFKCKCTTKISKVSGSCLTEICSFE